MKKSLQNYFSVNNIVLFLVLFGFTCIGPIRPSEAHGATRDLFLSEQLSKPISISMKNSTYREIIYEIQKSAGVNLVILDNDIDALPKMDFEVRDLPADQVLTKLFAGTDYVYKIGKKSIVIKKQALQQKAEEVKKIDVKGKVVDEKGMPIIGATVLLNQTHRGVVTDATGNFLFKALVKGDELVVSFIGYQTQHVKVTSPTLTVRMKVDVVAMDEVVVTGYQTLSKERATGSFGQISKVQLEKPASSIAERLVGTTSGVQSTVDDEGNIRFEIRGQTSLNAIAQPLVVVDGFPIQGDFSSINPNDVENITILKDAAAASI